MQINKEKLKVIGGALIVLAAVLVMFNQVFSFAFGIVRMATMILIALSIAWLITNAMVRLRGKKKAPELAAKNSESSDND
ncbi:MAG: hypothetical protein WCT03_03655 [Candidatus Obscuribacterales bacterium]|jgi:phage-related holin